MESTEIKKYDYNGTIVEFEISNTDADVMVNATEMAKIFNRDIHQFTKSITTKSFIVECLKPANASLLKISQESDLIISKQKSGTWMHRILALKFAAWLNPAFELWVFFTIEKLINENQLFVSKSIKRKNEIAKEIQIIDREINNLMSKRTKLKNENKEIDKGLFFQYKLEFTEPEINTKNILFTNKVLILQNL